LIANKRSDFAGFNSNRFDILLLAEEFLRAGVDFDFSKCRLIDAQNIYHKMERRNLAAAYEFYCGRKMEDDFTAHKADEDTEAAFRIGLALQVEDASGKVAETIDTIGKRYTGRGKFIATGDELRLLQQTADRFKAALEMAAWKHYVRAIKESEPILDAEAHRKRKKQEG